MNKKNNVKGKGGDEKNAASKTDEGDGRLNEDPQKQHITRKTVNKEH